MCPTYRKCEFYSLFLNQFFVICSHLQYCRRLLVINQSSTLSRWLQKLSLILSGEKPWGRVESVCSYFYAITNDLMRRAKLLFDLKDCVGRCSFGIHVSSIACKSLGICLTDVGRERKAWNHDVNNNCLLFLNLRLRTT